MCRPDISPPFLYLLASHHKYLGLQATNLSKGKMKFTTGKSLKMELLHLFVVGIFF